MKTASKRVVVEKRRKSAHIQRHKAKQAIVVRTPALPEHRYDLNASQVDLIKRTIAKGATDDELQLFLWVAKRHRLDPFTRQVHLVSRFDTAQNCKVATIQIGIDGYRQMASRYPDFGSVSEAEYEMNGKLPAWAKVKVFKKGISEPSVGVAYWEEYAPDLTDKKAFMWRKMPRHMLAKCAEAIALRKAYPDLADIYTNEEMARANQEVTPNGRQVVEVEPAGTQEAATQVAEAKLAEVGYVDALFYRYFPESETYQIGGSQKLMTANRELLKPFWSAAAGALVVTPEQLGKLISKFEDLKVPIRESK